MNIPENETPPDNEISPVGETWPEGEGVPEDESAAPEAAAEEEGVLEANEGEANASPEGDPRADHLRLVEALLFASAAPLAEKAIAERLPEGSDVADLLAELEELYRPRGVNLVRVAGGWSLRTAPDLGMRLRLEQKVMRKLSRAAVETLAIVAYHQPVTRAEIEEIRGVVISKGTLDTLMETGWIEPRGRRQTVGRPATWVTTEQFLLHFGLADIRDLPGVEELRAAGLVGPRPVVTLSETAPPAAEPDDVEEAEEPLLATDEGEAEEEPREETGGDDEALGESDEVAEADAEAEAEEDESGDEDEEDDGLVTGGAADR